MAIEKIKILGGPFWSHQLDSSANLAYLPQKWAGLAVLFSCLTPNSPQDFDFLNCQECGLFV